jgi:hypothetical protein
MADILDKLLNKFTIKNAERQTKCVIASALIILGICLCSSIYLLLFNIDLKVFANGEVVGFSDSGCPDIIAKIDSRFLDKIKEGQRATIVDRKTGRGFANFYIKDVNQSDESTDGFFDASVSCLYARPQSNLLDLHSQVEIKIVYEQKGVFHILLEKGI